MTLKKNLWPSLALGLFLSFFLHAPAMSQVVGYPISSEIHAVPFAESGNWWDVARPGEGLVLERQRNTIGMILFTYTASGEPHFYLATAPLTEYQLFVTPPVVMGSGQRNYVAHGTLYRFKNGPVFNSSVNYFAGDPPANESEAVGYLNASITPFTNTLRVEIKLDEGHVPEGSERSTTRYYRKSTFGYGGMGKYVDEGDTPYQSSRACWVDLRGRWVFVDNSNPTTRGAWSFHFTELETSPASSNMTCRDDWTASILADHVLTYRDTGTGATLRCTTKNIRTWQDPDFQPEDQRCVLRTGAGEGEPLLWFSVKDVGAKQIIATPGAPPRQHVLWRGLRWDDRITGLRVD